MKRKLKNLYIRRQFVGKLLPPRKKKKVEPMGDENMDESKFAFYNKYFVKILN